MRKFAIRAVAVLAVLLAFALVTNTALAQYFPPVPPTPIIIRETSITVSYTEPQQVITIDVTQFDPEQVVKEITLTLKEPVLTVSFTIYLLAERPPEVPEPEDKVVLLYFTIRAHEALLENVDPANITFAVEKTLVREKGVDDKTITLDWFFEGAWQELSTEKVGEDERFLFFEAESMGLSHFAVTGIAPPFPWWIVVIIVAFVIAVVAVAFIMVRIYLYRKRRWRP